MLTREDFIATFKRMLSEQDLGIYLELEDQILAHDKQQRDKLATLTSTWTTTPPKEPGWYWWREEKGAEPSFLKVGERTEDYAGKGPWILNLPEMYCHVSEYPGEWSDRPVQGPGEK